MVANLQIVAYISRIDIIRISTGSVTQRYILPVQGRSPVNPPDTPVFTRPIKSVDERPVATVVVRPVDILVMPRSDEAAALIDDLVLKVGKTGRRAITVVLLCLVLAGD